MHGPVQYLTYINIIIIPLFQEFINLGYILFQFSFGHFIDFLMLKNKSSSHKQKNHLSGYEPDLNLQTKNPMTWVVMS